MSVKSAKAGLCHTPQELLGQSDLVSLLLFRRCDDTQARPKPDPHYAPKALTGSTCAATTAFFGFEDSGLLKTMIIEAPMIRAAPIIDRGNDNVAF